MGSQHGDPHGAPLGQGQREWHRPRAADDFDPRRAIPDGLKGSNICSYTTGDDLSRATNGWHGGVHIEVGGTMADAAISPAAVIFFPWHAYVDNVYARWHDCR